MKRIIKSRLDEHMVDLYNRVDNLKKDISVIKNNHLKHMSCAIYKIEKKVDKKKAQPIVQKVKKCKKSLCKEPAVINGYCRYHYIAGWRTENIDKKVKKLNRCIRL